MLHVSLLHVCNHPPCKPIPLIIVFGGPRGGAHADSLSEECIENIAENEDFPVNPEGQKCHC